MAPDGPASPATNVTLAEAGFHTEAGLHLRATSAGPSMMAPQNSSKRSAHSGFIPSINRRYGNHSRYSEGIDTQNSERHLVIAEIQWSSTRAASLPTCIRPFDVAAL